MKEALPFKMFRRHDETGVSGTGLVCVGAVYPSGKCVVEWCVDGKPNSVAIHETFAAFLVIHVFSHPTNQTEIWMGEASPLS